MKDGLQDLGYDKVGYERPNQKWVCGWRREGKKCCRLGPDSRGNCRANYECLPAKIGSRYQCTRPPKRGGTCQKGPLVTTLTFDLDGRDFKEEILWEVMKEAEIDLSSQAEISKEEEEWQIRDRGVRYALDQEGKKWRLVIARCCHPIPKCQPVRSIRGKRDLLTFNVIALTLGIVLLFFTTSYIYDFLSPGRLTLKHALGEMTSGTSPNLDESKEKVCATCHETSGKGLGGLFPAFQSHSAETVQSRKCLKCHQLTKEKDQAFLVHSLGPKKLKEIRENLESKGKNLSSNPTLLTALSNQIAKVPERGGKLACARCHKEHIGSKGNIAAMDNRQCQICHTYQFSSFNKGHPPFDPLYPYPKERRINFDHHQHLREIKKERGAFACKDCHVPDSTGRYMKTREFERTCASCHNSTSPPRLASSLTYSPPRLLASLVSEINRKKESSKDEEFLRQLHSVKKILAEGEEIFRNLRGIDRALAHWVEVDGNLPGEGSRSQGEKEKLTAFTKALQKLCLQVTKMTSSGPGELGEKAAELDQIASFLARGEKEGEEGFIKANKIDFLSPYYYASFSKKLKKLLSLFYREVVDMAEVMGLKVTEESSSPEESPSLKVEVVDPFEKLNFTDFTGIEIRPLSQKSVAVVDPFEKLNFTDFTGLPISKGDGPGQKKGAGLDSFERLNREFLPSSPPEDQGKKDQKSETPLFLIREIKKALDSMYQNSISRLKEYQTELVKGLEIREEKLAAQVGKIRSSFQERDRGLPATSSSFSAFDMMINGRSRPYWRRGEKDSGFSLQYWLVGHRDPFYKKWLEESLSPEEGQKESGRKPYSKELKKTSCIRCHTLDGKEKRVNWKAYQPEWNNYKFTKFNHTKHFTLVKNSQGCKVCHKMVKTQVKESQLDFAPIEIETCQKCHTPNKSGDNCLLCHNYHIGKRHTEIPQTEAGK